VKTSANISCNNYQTYFEKMSDQTQISDFGNASADELDSYICEICGRRFDSSKGRGIHRGSSHSTDELKEAMIADIQRLADKLDSPPSQSQMDEKGNFSFSACQNHFGTWNNALTAANVRLNQENNISEDKLLDELTRLRDELGRTPTSRDMSERGCYASETYTRKFGNWNTAIQEAGLDLVRERKIQRDDLRSALQDLADELGRLPTHTEMEQKGKYAVNTYSREFGSWNNVLAGVFGEVNRQRSVDREGLIDEINQLAAAHDRIPAAVDMEKHGKFAIDTVAREFGSWNEGLKAAGYEPKQYRDIPKPKLLDELKGVADELDRTPKAEDMERDGNFGWSTYKTQFGSWNDALREADLEVTSRTNIPKEELKDELSRLRDELGHTPESREMSQYGEFDRSTYLTRFGSWNEALLEVGMEPNRAIYPDHLDHIVRSRWELTIADLLRQNGIPYEYESMEIEYRDGRTYTPDFITDGCVIEVKGRIFGNEHQKAVAALDSLNKRDYIVVGTELPADIHIPWENRKDLLKLF